jgi:hypothetical protein
VRAHRDRYVQRQVGQRRGSVTRAGCRASVATVLGAGQCEHVVARLHSRATVCGGSSRLRTRECRVLLAVAQQLKPDARVVKHLQDIKRRSLVCDAGHDGKLARAGEP